MRIAVSGAKGQLLELIRRAESGEDIVLTRHGVDIVRLVPVSNTRSAAAKRQLLAEVMASVADKVFADCDAARSQDFLYDQCGLPK